MMILGIHPQDLVLYKQFVFDFKIENEQTSTSLEILIYVLFPQVKLGTFSSKIIFPAKYIIPAKIIFWGKHVLCK